MTTVEMETNWQLATFQLRKTLATSLIAFGVMLTAPATQADTTAIYNDTQSCNGRGLPDADGDLIPDTREGMDDIDNDGVPNYLDTDSDNDGLPDSLEFGHPSNPADIDRDGVPNRIDANDNDATNQCIDSSWNWPALDMNNNGVADIVEAAPALYTDATDPCTVHGGQTDSDRDLIADIVEGAADIDSDGIPNYLDPDSDGDGISDRKERVFGVDRSYDWDNDGIPELVDIDDNTRAIACLVPMISPADLDSNGVHDYLEPDGYVGDNDPCLAHGGLTDSDGDLIADSVETDNDTDGDGLPNYLDLDSDNDGLSDRFEHQYNANTEHGSDYDKDGLFHSSDTDDYDREIVCLKPKAPPRDHKSDGLPDYLDPDSDDDGIIDSEELPYNGQFTLDADGDTLTDVEELALGLHPGKLDSDGGGALDDWELLLGANPNDPSDDSTLPEDLDIDNDGIPNALEKLQSVNRDTDGDGRSDSQEAGLIDIDNDGLVDDQTDANLNGWPDIAEGLVTLPDFDNDSVPDAFDVDSDQDGVADEFEFNHFTLPEGYTNNPNDVDGDGALNMHDLDSDDDGIFDLTELTSFILLTDPSNIIPHKIIKDSNNDGLVDEMRDDDGDLIPDTADHSYLPNQPDTDNDQIVDDADIDHAIRYYADLYGPDYGDRTRPTGDTDGDGIENERDPDANNDGGFDLLIDNPQPFTDDDQDGIPAFLDTDDSVAFVPVQPIAAAQPENTNTAANNSNPGSNTGAVVSATGGGGQFSAWMLLGLLLLWYSAARGFRNLRHSRRQY